MKASGGLPDPAPEPAVQPVPTTEKTTSSTRGFAIKVETARGESTAALPTVSACVRSILRQLGLTMKTAEKVMVTRFDLYETAGFRFEVAEYEESRVKRRNVMSYTAPNFPQFVPNVPLESLLSAAGESVV